VIRLTLSENNPRYQAYDETIKNLQVKDCKGLASIVIPNIDEAEDIMLKTHELSMADMKKPDYLAKIKLHGESFILHMEFESSFRSNKDMQRRMLRYYSNLYWDEELPIMQAVVLLRAPIIKNISTGAESCVLGENVLKHHYRVIKLYNMDKYDVLKRNITALFPLRVFMPHKNEQMIEHIKECLNVAETTEDPDYYFLTVECGRKLYGTDILENIVKEAIYMASELFRNPYMKGMEEGIMKGMEEGIMKGESKGKLEGKTDLIIKLLSSRFGLLSADLRKKISEADQYQLDLIAEGIFDFKSADDTLKCLQ